MTDNIIFALLSHRDDRFVVGGSYLQYQQGEFTITITSNSIDILAHHKHWRYE